MRIAGIILCGGSSSRMGRPKTWLMFEGETLLARAVRRLFPAVGGVIVSAAPEQILPSVGAPIHRLDDGTPGAGPLPALCGALEWAGQHGFSAAFVQGVDMPFASLELIPLGLQRLRFDDQALVAVVGGVRQPLGAVYRTTVAVTAASLISQGVRSLQRLLEAIPLSELTVEELKQIDPEGVSFRSIDTPADYAALLAEGKRPGRGTEPTFGE